MPKPQQIIFFLLCLLFALLPFHAFLTTWLNFLFFDPLTPPPVWLSLWKEVLICGIIGLSIWHIVKSPDKFRLDRFDRLFLGYILLIILVYFFNTPDLTLKAILASLKYGSFFLVFFFFLKKVPFSANQKMQLCQVLFYSSFLAILAGFFLFFISGYEVLIHFGYHPDASNYYAHRPIAYCQLMSNLDLCRNQATLSGPNQFASFLLIILILSGILATPYHHQGKSNWINNLIGRIKKFFKIQSHEQITQISIPNRQKLVLIFILALISIILTFSRSAWIGLIAALLIFSYLIFQNKKLFWASFITLIATVSGILLLISSLQHTTLNEIFIRPASSSGHASESLEALQSLLQHPMGHGLASVGPASRHLDNPLFEQMTENWYLQVGLELGLVGLVIFVILMFSVLSHFYNAYKNSQNPLDQKCALSIFLILIALGIMGFFLHVFESSETAYVFWGLAGVMYRVSDRKVE